MASSSAHDARNASKRLRNRNDNPGYRMTGSTVPKFIICNPHGPPLKSVYVPLARALALFDLQLVLRVRKFHQKRASSADETRKAEALRWIEDCHDISQQWKDIDSGRCHFSELYIKSNCFIPIWTEGMRIIKEALKSSYLSSNQSQKRDAYASILGRYESQADNLQTRMVDIARRGLFDPEFLNPIQERWMRLDETVELYYDLYNRFVDVDDEPYALRSSLPWLEVRSSIQVDDGGIRSDDKLNQTQIASRSSKATEPDTTAGSKAANIFIFILWTGVITNALALPVFFTLGYSRSLHLQGTTNDADFYFLIQATLVQVQSLVNSALLERKRGHLPKWRWAIPAAIAAGCSTMAIPLYLTVPKEWSSFLSLVAGTIQSFMILQLWFF